LNLDETQENSLGLYPNPANNTLHFSSVQNGTLQFFSTQGRIVYETILNNDLDIDVAHLPRGMYVVKLSNNETVAQQKLILK